MILSAYVRDRQTKEYLVVEKNYPTKEAFKRDLHGNGYTVKRISNKRDIAAQNCNYESFAVMKKNMDLYMTDPKLWKYEINRIKEIEAIKLD